MLGELVLQLLERQMPIPPWPIHQQQHLLPPRQRFKPAEICRREGQGEAIHNQIATPEGVGPVPGCAAGGKGLAAQHPQRQRRWAVLQ